MKSKLKAYRVSVDLSGSEEIIADSAENAVIKVEQLYKLKNRRCVITRVEELQTLYANEVLYTDVHPFEVVKINTESKMTIRPMNYIELPWKKEVVVGGFSAIVLNDRDQKWKITPNENAETMTLRLHKDGKWYSKGGTRFFLDSEPHKYYDNNF